MKRWKETVRSSQLRRPLCFRGTSDSLLFQPPRYVVARIRGRRTRAGEPPGLCRVAGAAQMYKSNAPIPTWRLLSRRSLDRGPEPPQPLDNGHFEVSFFANYISVSVWNAAAGLMKSSTSRINMRTALRVRSLVSSLCEYYWLQPLRHLNLWLGILDSIERRPTNWLR